MTRTAPEPEPVSLSEEAGSPMEAGAVSEEDSVAEEAADEDAAEEIAAEEAAYDPDTLAEEAMLDEAADMTAQTLSDTEETPVQQPDADDAAR